MKNINRIERILLAAVGMITVMMMTGCWDDAEINGRAFVLGFGADGDRENRLFTFQLAIPVSGESDSSGSIEYSSRTVAERTPAEAVRRLEKDLGRQINFEQLSLIVIGEKLSRRRFVGLTDFFFRRASVRRQSCIAVCKDSAEKFFASSATDKAISVDAASMLQSYDSGGGISMDLFSLYKTLINRDEFYLPKISATSPEPDSASDGEKTKSLLTISGASAYGREGDYRGDISEDELELLRLTCGSGTGGAISVSDEQGNRYCCEIKQSDCSVRCGIVDDLPEFTLRLELVLVPLDAGGTDGDVYSAESTKKVARSAERTVKERLSSLADRSRQSLGSSVLGFQDIIRQRRPDWYALHEDEWESLYRMSKIVVTVNCTAAGGGITK